MKPAGVEPDPGSQRSVASSQVSLPSTSSRRCREWIADGETCSLHSVLHHRRQEPDPKASVTLRIDHDLLFGLLAGQRGLKDLIFGDELDIDGSRLDLVRFFSLMQAPDETFPIVTP